jgi:hypothetical protein
MIRIAEVTVHKGFEAMVMIVRVYFQHSTLLLKGDGNA